MKHLRVFNDVLSAMIALVFIWVVLELIADVLVSVDTPLATGSSFSWSFGVMAPLSLVLLRRFGWLRGLGLIIALTMAGWKAFTLLVGTDAGWGVGIGIGLSAVFGLAASRLFTLLGRYFSLGAFD
ncbi:hypothetical protein A2V54_03515 [candidate division WWE3 bacterium RBG_19FT_COMBO_53_11]|uniref:Uncharacterized protein n=1 Tax=candidate division WWE3 bacterium RBG_19FT_COMBO_53_11 TaxID=1802613 RepID=A0A1F4UHH8_UNCKA|nr:MAG: hypothetical protein A2V54_03515 [candidate division WWE3 bacterium RBG_19FT_COMBO_53_11]